MSKRVYISADYSPDDGDRNVVDELHRWGNDNYHKVDYTDTALVVKGSVSKQPDCRPCDLKDEFNKQINASSAVIFIIGDKTASRTAGSSCRRNSYGFLCSCTPYKQNANGSTLCKVSNATPAWYEISDVFKVNGYSYLRHEFEQAKKRGKTIIILYNSLYKQSGWLPSYMSGYEKIAYPFWTYNAYGRKVGNYSYIKKALGYE